MTTPARKSVEEYPWAEVVNWHRHQPPQADQGKFIRNMTRLLVKGRYRLLTPAERGLLHGIWLLRSLSGSNIPRASETLREALGVPAGRWLESALWTLENRGWLLPRKSKRTGQRRDEDEDEDEDQGVDPQTVENVLKATFDLPGGNAESVDRSRVAAPKTVKLPSTYPEPTQAKAPALQSNREAELHQRRESRGERGDLSRKPPPPDPGCRLCGGRGATKPGDMKHLVPCMCERGTWAADEAERLEEAGKGTLGQCLKLASESLAFEDDDRPAWEGSR